MQQPTLPFTPDSDWFRCTAHFLDQIEARTGSTGSRVEYRNVLIAFLSSNPKPPADYTREDIENFILAPCRRNQRKGQPPSAGTVNNRLTILASWFRYATTFAVAGTDGAPVALYRGTPPTTNIRLLNRGRAPYKALTPDELRQFFAAIPRETVRGTARLCVVPGLFHDGAPQGRNYQAALARHRTRNVHRERKAAPGLAIYLHRQRASRARQIGPNLRHASKWPSMITCAPPGGWTPCRAMILSSSNAKIALAAAATIRTSRSMFTRPAKSLRDTPARSASNIA